MNRWQATMRLTPKLALLWSTLCLAPAGAGDLRTFVKWSKIELTFTGPASSCLGKPNPFAVRLDVDFISPTGKRYRVPGFYDGDGKGAFDGDVWKVRFSADELGQWKFTTNSDQESLDGQTGRFTVTKTPESARGFWKWGRLESVGTADNKIRYLKFRDGPYWLKAGCDDPENFLGNYRNYNTLAKRKTAIDYLADRGINSLYIVTHNIGGDDRDVWPWLGTTQREAKSNGGSDARFDVVKLEEWRQLFEYMQAKGVVPYLVLEDDSAWKEYDHGRYYRELVARFGYLPALVLNCGEEHNENYSLPQALQLMRQLQQIDPYDHPRGIHNVNRPENSYVDAEQIDFTSIQTGSPGSRKGLASALEHNRIAIGWIDRCIKRRRRVLVVNFDEARPEEDRRCWWSVYLGGGVWETHVRPPYDRPPSAWEPVWTQLGGARRFMESMPFWEMEPHNELVKNGELAKAGRAFCLAKPGYVYAIYLPSGGSITVTLAPNGRYDLAWWNPANGKDGEFTSRQTISGGPQRLTAPGSGDWALRIVRQDQVTIADARSNKSGIMVHSVTSPYQSGKTEIRVLLPDSIRRNHRYPVVYVLPVEARQESRFGDGLLEVKRHDLHNKHQAIFVSPTFSDLPWYADHASKPERRQETYLLKVVMPFVDSNYPTSPTKQERFLLGFSKSGWGAWSLLLRHRNLFGKAAAWDAPLMMERMGKYGSGAIYGTQANFERYQITRLLKDGTEELRHQSRLVLTGYGNFREHHTRAHRYLQQLGVRHTYLDGPQREHCWDSGWLPEATSLLFDPASNTAGRGRSN